jgi:hypothetical protein
MQLKDFRYLARRLFRHKGEFWCPRFSIHLVQSSAGSLTWSQTMGYCIFSVCWLNGAYFCWQIIPGPRFQIGWHLSLGRGWFSLKIWVAVFVVLRLHSFLEIFRLWILIFTDRLWLIMVSWIVPLRIAFIQHYIRSGLFAWSWRQCLFVFLSPGAPQTLICREFDRQIHGFFARFDLCWAVSKVPYPQLIQSYGFDGEWRKYISFYTIWWMEFS